MTVRIARRFAPLALLLRDCPTIQGYIASLKHCPVGERLAPQTHSGLRKIGSFAQSRGTLLTWPTPSRPHSSAASRCVDQLLEASTAAAYPSVGKCSMWNIPQLMNAPC
jgi:hypothetical protein